MMPQVFVPPEEIKGKEFTIRGSEAHHILNVLRKKTDDKIEFFDGAGNRYKGQLSFVDAENLLATGRILESIKTSPKKYHISLYQGLPRGSKFDYVIEKATELGVDEIIPFLSEKNAIQLNSAQSASKVKRWSKIILAASKQCGRDDIPKIHLPLTFSGLVSKLKDVSPLVFHLGQDSLSLKALLHKTGSQNRRLHLVVGPESGFSSGELGVFQALKAQLAKIGENTLRSETAGLVALSSILYDQDIPTS